MPHRVRYIGDGHPHLRGRELLVIGHAAANLLVEPPNSQPLWINRACLEDVEGQEPLPEPVGGPDMQDLVKKDLEARHEVGRRRYGQGLKANDGRDNLRDIYEELMDACVYVRKQLYERDGK